MSNYDASPNLGEFDDVPSLLQSAGPFQTEDVDGHGLLGDPESPAAEQGEVLPGASADAANDDDVEGHFRLQ